MGYRHLELTAIKLERLDQLLPFLAEQPAALDPFERVSIHAPAAEACGSTDSVVLELAGLDDGFDIVLHPDVYMGEPSVVRLGGRAVFENMDCRRTSAGRPPTSKTCSARSLRLAFAWTLPTSGRTIRLSASPTYSSIALATDCDSCMYRESRTMEPTGPRRQTI
jgi:hypothetical protein